jgi:hypothetical protein
MQVTFSRLVATIKGLDRLGAWPDSRGMIISGV